MSKSVDSARGVRVLLIDNYSSFTYNLYQFLAEMTGCAPLVLRNDSALDEVELKALLAGFDAVVLSPGPGHPSSVRDFGICARLLDEQDLAILGVCLGHEGLGFHHGGRVGRANEPYHGRASRIRHSDDELFAGIPSEFSGVRYHSLALLEPLPAALRPIARTLEGDLMAIRHAERPHWGVQFHPESAQTEHGKTLLANFCALAKATPRERQPGPASAATLRERSKAAPTKLWRVLRRELHQVPACLSLFRELYGDSTSAFWLDGGADQSVSYFGDASGPHGYQLRYSLVDSEMEFRGCRRGTHTCDSVFDYLEAELADNHIDSPAGRPSLAEFQGGFVGYFGYELKAECGARSLHRSRHPDAYWVFCHRFVTYDHKRDCAILVTLVPPGAEGQATDWFDEVAAKLSKPLPTLAAGPAHPQASPAHWRHAREEYLTMVERCQERIRAGESYELCLTTQAEVKAAVDALGLYEELRASNPAPYAAFIECDDFALASSSPECFLKIDKEGLVESRPIKGTAARDGHIARDAALAEALLTSAKERAENLMIVDLVRNDLGRSSRIGSVIVDSFAALESYATVHQLVSRISGRLLDEVSRLACVRAAFPGGSMTGAPKLRSMEILEELEGDARGPYSGSLGYLSLCGSVDLNIVIRTALIEAERVTVGVGGAITTLSEPCAEHDEAALKAKATLAAIARAPRRGTTRF